MLNFFWCFASVSDVCCKCFNCFGHMLQIFPQDVTKVDQDVAYVVIAIHVCFECMFQKFHLSSIPDECCKCFVRVLQHTCMLQAYVSSIFRCFIRMFASVSSRWCCICLQWFSRVFICFFKCFRRLLKVSQLFRADVASISSECFKSRSNVAHVVKWLSCHNRLL